MTRKPWLSECANARPDPKIRSPNWTALRAAMKEPVVFDGRNLYEPQEMKENGMQYVAIGRCNFG